jgi:TRAP-type C4-dicarboxylate transport system substrate-binding protein
MNRKTIKAILGAVFVLCFVLTTLSTAADQVVVKFGDPAPSRAPISKFFANWCNKVTKDSGGTLKVEHISGGILGKSGQMIDRIKNNVAQLGWELPSYLPGRYPKLDVVSLPFRFDTAEAGGVALWRMYEKGMMDEYFKDLIPLYFIAFPNSSFLTKKKIDTFEGFRKMKIGSGSKWRSLILEHMGATPVSMPIHEIYQGLSRGVIDGHFTQCTVIYPFRLHEVLNYALLAPMGGGFGFALANKKAFDALPDAAKKAIMDNSGEKTTRAISRMFDKDGQRQADKFSKEPGHGVRQATEEELKPLRKLLAPIIEEFEQSFPNGREFVDVYAKEIAAVEVK